MPGLAYSGEIDMEGVVQQLVDDPDYVIKTNSFPSYWLDDIVDYVLHQLRDSDVSNVISSVEIERWIREIQPKSSKEVRLEFYHDWDVLGVDLLHMNGSKIGTTSWLTSGVIISILEFLDSRDVSNSLYKPSLSECVEIDHHYLYGRLF